MELLETVRVLLTYAAALGSGVVAGAFFAFSSFVMPALARLPPEGGIAAMQQINVVVLRSLFLVVFIGTAVACALLGVITLVNWPPAGALWLLAGAGLYLIGTFAVTGMRNVPLNNLLAEVAPFSQDSARLWVRYLVDWTFWNHLRTIAALAATIALLMGVR